MVCPSASATLINTTFGGNTCDGIWKGGAISFSNTAALTAKNCIAWGDYPDEFNGSGFGSVSYSNIQQDSSVYAGTGNINSDPMFIDSASGDLRLYGVSPCVNTGENSYNPETYDIRGQVRIQDTAIDMGCYEWTDGTDPGFISPDNIAINRDSGSTLLEWNEVIGAVSYKVYRSEDPYSGFSQIGISPTNLFTDPEVLSGNKYFYYVIAVSVK